MSSSLRRINFFGGPGVGKSTTTTAVFSRLKKMHFDIEYIQEYIKPMAYEGRHPQSFDQVHIMSQQLHAEDIALRHVNFVLTECPLLLCVAYNKFYGFAGVNGNLINALEFEEQFPSINILLQRGDIDYNAKGRFQDYENAIKFDDYLHDFLKENCQVHQVFNSQDDVFSIVDFVEGKLSGSKNS